MNLCSVYSDRLQISENNFFYPHLSFRFGVFYLQYIPIEKGPFDKCQKLLIFLSIFYLVPHMKRLTLLLSVLLPIFGFAQKVSDNLSSGNLLNPTLILQQYVRIPSESGQEAKAGTFFKQQCENAGLHITEMGNEDGKFNFMASLFPPKANKPNIILLNHIDVIPESDGNQFGPYSGKIDNGKIYGRGSIDNKGVAVMQLSALNQIKHNVDYQNSPYNISVLAVSCEETQCPGGVQYIIEKYWDQLNPAVVIGEGATEITELVDEPFSNPIFGISLVHKRVYWIELELEIPVIAHGSITPLAYANQELVAALHRLTKKKEKAIFNEVNTGFLKQMAPYHTGLERFVLKNPRLFKSLIVPKLRKTPEIFSIFSNTITLTNLKSESETVNSNSMIATAGIDCRLMPETNEEEFKQELKKRLDNDKIKINVIKSTPKTSPSSNDNLFYKNLSLAINENYPKSGTITLLMPNFNDLGYFRAKNVPCYGSVPIALDRDEAKSIHGENECISIQSLNQGAETYFSFLKKMIFDSGE